MVEGLKISVVVTNAGSGYANLPIVIINPPVISSPVLGIGTASLLLFSNLTLASNYQLQSLSSWYWSNQPVNFTATNSVFATAVSGSAKSGNYRLALSPVPTQAFATGQIISGFVVAANVTSGGSGYATAPVVNIVGGGGMNAVAIAHVSGGAVTSISMSNAGTGYTNIPAVEIAPPPATATFPTVFPVIRVDSASLAPYNNYQIQYRTNLAGTWTNLNGGLFVPTNVTNSQYIVTTNGNSFFRLLYVP